MADKAKDLGKAAGGLLEGTRLRGDDTVAPRAATGGVRGGRTGGGKVKVASYIAPEDAEALATLAERQDRSVSWLVADAIRRYLAAAG
jgi:hypothetical protein